MSGRGCTCLYTALALFMLCVMGVSSAPVQAQEGPPSLTDLLQEVEAARPRGEPPPLDPAKSKFPFGHFYRTIEIEEKEDIPTEFTGAAPTKTFELPDFKITGKLKRGNKSRIFIGRKSLRIGESSQGAKLIRLDFRNGEATFLFQGTRFKREIP